MGRIRSSVAGDHWPPPRTRAARRYGRDDAAGVDLKADSSQCLKVACLLARIDGRGEITSCWCPDDFPQRNVQTIDLEATAADGTTIALEHTKIESYEDQFHEAEQVEILLRPLIETFAGRLPSDRRYCLDVAPGAVADRSLDPDLVLRSVGGWVATHAETLPPGSPDVAPRHFLSGGPPDLPIQVVLSAWRPQPPAGPGGSLTVGGLMGDPEVMELRRVLRLQRALSKKLPKLMAHPASHRVLVLEDLDMATSNISDVWVALQAAAGDMTLCDRIVVVETWLESPPVTVVYEDGTWLPDFQQNCYALSEQDTSIELLARDI